VAKKSGAANDCTGGTVTKLYRRSLSGDALAETDSSGSTTNSAYNEYVFFDGRRIAQRTGTGAIYYYFADQIGSTRTITTRQWHGPNAWPALLRCRLHPVRLGDFLFWALANLRLPAQLQIHRLRARPRNRLRGH